MDRYHLHCPTATGKSGKGVSTNDIANAKDYFEHFLNATSLKHILGYYRSICDLLNLKPTYFIQFYPKLRCHLTSWRAKALWKKFDARASHKCYNKGKACTTARVLIIGAGPCGLRTAIEAQLLGAKVVVVEKRDRFSRNNVLHLWPFVIEDLRGLGAKKFFGKFCAGAIDHISIRQLQCILLKVALLLGVEVHTEVGFECLLEPHLIEKTGWKAVFSPSQHPVSQYEFNVIIGADGKRNTLQGFKRKEFRGKLAIAITANFINKRTEAEARVEEISGVAFIFNQKFFKELYEATGIDLENIVYYKDDTHYFVMTAKKSSLIDKGVIIRDVADTDKLLAPENVDREALMAYARLAANFSTEYQMPDIEFAVNHYGQSDVAMFDFTSMYAAENASKVIERHGYRLLVTLVGDSLLEPFWPTGSGCARGFLSSFDAAWLVRSWCIGVMPPLDAIAERESIYRLLAQTTPDNLNKDVKAYTLDPSTRYPNLNKNAVLSHQVTNLIDSTSMNVKNVNLRRTFTDSATDIPVKKRKEHIDGAILLNWIQQQIKTYEDIDINDVKSVFSNGKVLCALIDRYRPDLLDYNHVQENDPVKNNELAVEIFDKEIGIVPVMTGEELTNTTDIQSLSMYLTEIYNKFRCEIPQVRYPRMELPSESKRSEIHSKSKSPQPNVSNIVQQALKPLNRNKRHVDVPHVARPSNVDKKSKKRKTLEKLCINFDERRQRIQEDIANNRFERMTKRKQQRKFQTEQFLKSMQMLQANAKVDNSQPFEDYSIFVYRQTAPNFEDRVKSLEKKFSYIPNYENKTSNTARGNIDDDFAARIRNMENKWRYSPAIEKKPKDLLRAIGKIETSDWNIKEIEKKIKENKLGKPKKHDTERVPKWSREQFVARQNKMEKKHLDHQNSGEEKFADIDKSIKHLELKLKEGTVRDLGQMKVAHITEKLKNQTTEKPAPQIMKCASQPVVILPKPGTSENCYFCNKRVYLMERVTAEGKIFHHGCFKCQYCNTQLRLGSYAFDREGLYGYNFFCVHHYGMQSELKHSKSFRKATVKSTDEKYASNSNRALDQIDRNQTPERAEFANLSTGSNLSENDANLSQMDEDEWTDRNFGASAAEYGSTDDESSSVSELDSEEDDSCEEILEEPATKEGTLKWAERFNKKYFKNKHKSDSEEYVTTSDQSSYYENTTDDEDSDTATEGEEDIRARELRKQEVRVEPPIVHTDTGTDTEVVSMDSSSSSTSPMRNSATEISTDSEFAADEPKSSRKVPIIIVNDQYVTKTRGSRNISKRCKEDREKDRHLFTKNTEMTAVNPPARNKPISIIASTIQKKSPVGNVAQNDDDGYALNRTQSTGGIATKVSLELKKKYLLGEVNSAHNIQKSGSASALDTKLKVFNSNISDCQKMLKPATETNSVTRIFHNDTLERLSPLSSRITSKPKSENVEECSNDYQPPSIDLIEKDPCEMSDDMKNEKTINYVTSESKNHNINDPITKGNRFKFDEIPIVTIENVDDDNALQMDSLYVDDGSIQRNSSNHSSLGSDTYKTLSTIKKSLNEPKSLPKWEPLRTDSSNASDGPSLISGKIQTSDNSTNKSIISNSSQHDNDQNTLSSLTSSRGSKQSKSFDLPYGAGAHDKSYEHVCGKSVTIMDNNLTATLSKYLDKIEFHDTLSETSSDEPNNNDCHNSYTLFNNEEDEIVEDSLNPNINLEIGIKSDVPIVLENAKSMNRNFGGEVVNLHTSDIEKLKYNSIKAVEVQDSLLVIEPENSGAMNKINQNVSFVESSTANQLDLDKTHESNKNKDKLFNTFNYTNDKNLVNFVCSNMITGFQENCPRLQSQIDFCNAKDSLDVRKQRKKHRTSSETGQVDVNNAYDVNINNDRNNVLNLVNLRSTDCLYKKEIIDKERNTNQKLVQELVMDKMKSANKSLERKKRLKNISNSNSRSFELSKSATIDISPLLPKLDTINISTPKTCVPNVEYLDNRGSIETKIVRPPISMSDNSENFRTPDNRSIPNYLDAIRTTEKLRYEARQRVKLLTNEELGLSPEDRMQKLKEKIGNIIDKTPKFECANVSSQAKARNQSHIDGMLQKTDRECHTLNTCNVKSNCTSSNNDQYRTPKRTKSISEIARDFVRSRPLSDTAISDQIKSCKSDPSLGKMEVEETSRPRKSKDRERRKSITKMITGFFKKTPTNSAARSPSPPKFNILKKIEQRSLRDVERPHCPVQISHNVERTSSSPPPVPPLPLNYTGTSLHGTDDSSNDEYNWRDSEISSCDTLEQHSSEGYFVSHSNSQKPHKCTKKISRQAHLKRHRMAQEIQRKLEETEVKARELENRGVSVERCLRSASFSHQSHQMKSNLQNEWFDLVKNITALKRYEKELLIKAQELELEDRHARLQHELKYRLQRNDQKSHEDIIIERTIINEMMDIVAKKEKLQNMMEEDKLRYLEECKDFEERMLEKGLQLTTFTKDTDK